MDAETAAAMERAAIVGLAREHIAELREDQEEGDDQAGDYADALEWFAVRVEEGGADEFDAPKWRDAP